MPEGHQKSNTNEPMQTGGEKLFDWVTYFGIGWLANAGIGVGAYMMSNDGTVGKNGTMGTHAAKRDGELEPVYQIRKALFNGREWAVSKANNAVLDNYNNNDFHKGTYTDVTKRLSNIEGFAPKNTFSEENSLQFFFDEYKHGKGSFESLKEHLNEGQNKKYSLEDVVSVRDMAVNKQRWLNSAHTLSAAGAISVGGFLAMIPVKLMEDHKLPITQAMDGFLDNVRNATGQGFASNYEKDRVMQARQERYDFIDNAPSQSWGSVLLSRIASLVPFYTTYVAVANKDNIISGMTAKLSGNEYADPESGFKGTDAHIVDGINCAVEATDKYVPGGSKIVAKINENRDAFDKAAKMWSTDVIYSWFVAEMTYGFTRIFGPMLNKGKEQEAQPLAEKPSSDNHVATVTANNIPSIKTHDTPTSSVAEMEKDGHIISEREVEETKSRENLVMA